ncbi:hypothetical protein [Candidatus Methanoperedens sp. BLZ2]|nr:hypothetical protein [Candidatus Methanoperedens sp. BLZ2]KAB2944448.1 MAG: hypothetical protein F9K14_14670 [Candidatus Methanoperedens sp.]MBZ0174909.1 hypothetical protein [Candidatus Methanoperedens nitroreducens]
MNKRGGNLKKKYNWEKYLKIVVSAMVILLMADGVLAVASWAPNQFTYPDRIYDDGTYVEYFQWFAWDQAHANDLHSKTGSNGKYQHEFSRDVDKWDFQSSLCIDYGWWTNLPDVHEASEEATYPWCDLPFLQNDEEAELVTYSPQNIQANTWYYMDVIFKKRTTSGTLELLTQAEYADYRYDFGPDSYSDLTRTTEVP